jgi:hypothetical protein
MQHDPSPCNLLFTLFSAPNLREGVQARVPMFGFADELEASELPQFSEFQFQLSVEILIFCD